MQTSQKIMTLHPEPGKKGVNISSEKYGQIKEFILHMIEKHQHITYQDLNDLAVKQLSKTFTGKVPWYLVTVKLDLEARKIIERIPGSSPQVLQLVKKSKSNK